MMLLIILEILLILDIALTEYALLKKLVKELNPLMRNYIIRRVIYIPKLMVIIIVYNILPEITSVIMFLIIIQSTVDLNNIYELLKIRKYELFFSQIVKKTIEKYNLIGY